MTPINLIWWQIKVWVRCKIMGKHCWFRYDDGGRTCIFCRKVEGNPFRFTSRCGNCE